LPVEVTPPARAAYLAGRRLRALAGDPPVIDVVHLGLGVDGHTASLVPDDPVLDETSLDVAATGVYQGRRRLTLTAPVLSRARRVVWLVVGDDKREALRRLLADDPSIPATRVTADDQLVVTDLDVEGSAPGP
jgi:6-phosphogluconolactonase